MPRNVPTNFCTACRTARGVEALLAPRRRAFSRNRRLHADRCGDRTSPASGGAGRGRAGVARPSGNRTLAGRQSGPTHAQCLSFLLFCDRGSRLRLRGCTGISLPLWFMDFSRLSRLAPAARESAAAAGAPVPCTLGPSRRGAAPSPIEPRRWVGSAPAPLRRAGSQDDRRSPLASVGPGPTPRR